jgi:16S rRNA (cytosine967-C5)-methyltransferase
LKIFRPNCEAIILTLSQVFNDGSHLGKTLDKTLHSNKKLGAKDRHFIAQAVYEIVRYKRLFTHLSNQEYNSQNIDCNQVLGAYLLKNEVELPAYVIILFFFLLCRISICFLKFGKQFSEEVLT